jgi:hypothetical protein
LGGAALSARRPMMRQGRITSSGSSSVLTGDSPEIAMVCSRTPSNLLGVPLRFTEEFEVVILIAVADRRDGWVGPLPDLRDYKRAWCGTNKSQVCIVSSAPTCIYLDKHMLGGVYEESGICIRNHCGAEPPGYIEPPGLVPTIGGRDRASTWYAADDGVKTSARAACGRFRGIHGGRTAPSLPAET